MVTLTQRVEPVSTEHAEAAPHAGGGPSTASTRRSWGPHRTMAVILAVGLIVTFVLALAASTARQRNESRLLDLQVRQAGLVLTAGIPNVSTPLASALTIAVATGGDTRTISVLLDRYVGAQAYDSISVWQLTPAGPQLVTQVGDPQVLATTPTRLDAVLAGTRTSSTVHVVDLLQSASPRLGYALGATVMSHTYAVYGERLLHTRLKVASNLAFSELNYALYLGPTARAADLLGSQSPSLPIPGPTASASVPFGNTVLHLVAAAKTPLAGSLSEQLPWVIAVGGVLLTLGGTLTAGRLARRRLLAETLAVENRRLYAEQRSIAETLQRSLVPDRLPQLPGIEARTRYVAGVVGIDVGGDWCDVVPLADGRVFFAVGDVSGRGLEAATIMASLHFAIRAYAVQGDEPAVVLSKLGKLLSVTRDGHFATVLCGVADVAGHTITVANAGHLPLLLMADGDGEIVTNKVDRPIGIDTVGSYGQVTVTVPAGATLLAFTDGLVERRGEDLMTGLDRLRSAATAQRGSLDRVLAGIVDELIPAGAEDDAAILGIRWVR
jgi:serine phosphatase RsbU (regulator of sigma subunit)